MSHATRLAHNVETACATLIDARMCANTLRTPADPFVPARHADALRKIIETATALLASAVEGE